MKKGAFTGATRSRRGWIELAHSGTLFLDEIGEMPPHLQVKLLRILQTREVQRVGGESYISVDVRIMAATNRDLSADVDVEAGRFRSDLYYRLSVVTLEIPPLRERPEDIAELADRYIAHFQANFASPVERIHPAALQALQRYPWPGNIRELINIVERAMLLCYESEIRLTELPVAVQKTATQVLPLEDIVLDAESIPTMESCLDRPLKEARRKVLDSFEKRYLAELLKATGGKIGETARRAGVDPRSVYMKMRRLGLNKNEFKKASGIGPS